MQQTLPFETRLDLQSCANAKLCSLLDKKASEGDLLIPTSLRCDELIWKADYFDLDKSRLFQQIDESGKFRILKKLNLDLLTEIYFIERCGMYYAAKMGLLAESVQERVMFGIMGADESLHYLWVSSLCGSVDPTSYRQHPFLKFLDCVLIEEEKNILIAVIQMILEGWGLRHYRKLAEHSHHEQATSTLRKILKDEAYHHGAGLILFDPKKQTSQLNSRLSDILKVFFDMIRCGPQMVISAVQEEVGSLSQMQKIDLLGSVNGREESQKSLSFLKSLLITTKISRTLIDDLDDSNRFSPFSDLICADFN